MNYVIAGFVACLIAVAGPQTYRLQAAQVDLSASRIESENWHMAAMQNNITAGAQSDLAQACLDRQADALGDAFEIARILSTPTVSLTPDNEKQRVGAWIETSRAVPHDYDGQSPLA